jgi:hypothetical protein
MVRSKNINCVKRLIFWLTYKLDNALYQFNLTLDRWLAEFSEYCDAKDASKGRDRT